VLLDCTVMRCCMCVEDSDESGGAVDMFCAVLVRIVTSAGSMLVETCSRLGESFVVRHVVGEESGCEVWAVWDGGWFWAPLVLEQGAAVD
jgi:hypothetical protein